MSETKETYWSNDQLKNRINYNANDKLHGPYERWYENGQQRVKVNCVNDQWHGPCERWYEDGQLQKKRQLLLWYQRSTHFTCFPNRSPGFICS